MNKVDYNKVRANHYWVFLVFVICMAAYAIYAKRPLLAEPWQWADDGLYWQQALNIQKWLAGESQLWLGEYSQTILSKVPFFAIFLVATNASGIPMQVLQFLLLIFLAIYLLKALHPIYQPGFAGKAIILFILVCHPYLPSELRLVRNIHSATLTGYFLTSLIGLLLRAGASVRQQALWAAASGLFLSLCYLCREEGPWLAVPAVMAVACLSIVGWRQRPLLQLTATPLILTVAFFIPVVLVSMMNFHSYGAFVTTDRRAPQFVKAFKLLASLEPANARPFVPMPEKTRRKVYRVCPSFAKLQPHLEGKITDHMATNPAHLALNGAQPGEREFFVSTFEWGLRSAVWEAGIKTFYEQEEFWKSVVEEVERAVAQGKLDQGNKPLALCAPLRDGDPTKILLSTFNSFWSLFLLKGAHIPYDPRSSGNEADVASMGALANSQLAPIKTSAFKLPNNTPVRAALFSIFNKGVQFFYVVGFIAPICSVYFLLCGFLRGQMDRCSIQLLACSILCLLTLALFCLMMGVLEVCGWPHLKYGNAYNYLGSILLSINSCVGVAQISFLRKLTIPYKQHRICF